MHYGANSLGFYDDQGDLTSKNLTLSAIKNTSIFLNLCLSDHQTLFATSFGRHLCWSDVHDEVSLSHPNIINNHLNKVSD